MTVPPLSRLGLRLAGGFLAAALVPLLGSAWLGLELAQGSVERDAARRQREVCQHVAGLLRVFTERTQQELETIATLVAEDLASNRAGAWSTSNTLYVDTVADRLRPLMDGPSPFLGLQVYAQAPAAPGRSELVADFPNRQRAVQGPAPAAAEGSEPWIHSRAAGDAVQQPQTSGQAYRSPGAEQVELLTCQVLSVPVPGPDNLRPEVLVADVDLSGLAALVAAVAGDEYALRLVDLDGTVLVDVGAFEGPALGQELTFAEGEWQVTVSEPRAAVHAPLAALRHQTLWWAAFAAMLAGAGSVWLSTRITRPVARLERAAGELARGRLATRTGLTGDDEIGRLGQAFDRMAAAVEELDTARSQFVANASHELRTPLTSLRLSVANLLDGVVGDLAPQQRTALERVRGDLERMIRLVQDLLALARLDAGVEAVRAVPVELGPLVREALLELEPAAAAAQVGLLCRGQGPACADPALVRRMVCNLVDNAVQHSPRGSTVEVEVDAGRIVVRDRGPGLPEGPLFERFRRGEPERSGRPGFGLGLSLVRQWAELCGGSVAAHNDGGAVLTVRLPVAAPAGAEPAP